MLLSTHSMHTFVFLCFYIYYALKQVAWTFFTVEHTNRIFNIAISCFQWQFEDIHSLSGEQPLYTYTANTLVFAIMFSFFPISDSYNWFNYTKTKSQYGVCLGQIRSHVMLLILAHEISLRFVFLQSFCSILFQVYVIGEEGILEELKLAGFTGIGGPVRESI